MLLIAKMESQIFGCCICLIHQLHKANKRALKRCSLQFSGRGEFSIRTCFGKVWKGIGRKSKRQKQSEMLDESKKMDSGMALLEV